MKQIKSIQLKAAFLLAVFALNTLIAFACSMGMNLGYNKKHHNKENEELASTPCHQHSLDTSARHQNDTDAPHQEDVVSKHSSGQENRSQDDCCNKSAVQFQQVDKSLSHAAKIPINTHVILLAYQYANNIHLYFSNIAARRFHFIPPDYPPKRDIRIAIQSFQI